MFQPKYLKQAKLLKKGVRKFLHYKRDLISDEELEEIEGKLDAFGEAVSGKDKEAIKESAKSLTKACERSVPPPSHGGLRENLEVIFVAVVIAVGIRAYFLQPFRIPTGSMQPTLNGVIAHAHKPALGAFDKPGFLGRAFDKVAEGRTYVDFEIPAGSRISAISDRTRFKFFTTTTIDFADAAQPPLKIKAPKAAAISLLRECGAPLAPDGRPLGQTLTEALPVQGWIDTGDQVLVNKFSYHFRRPKRGEVFVFSTRALDVDQPGSSTPPLPAGHSQHYIKRLCGVPGDELVVRRGDDRLYVNGEAAAEETIQRVWGSTELGYGGYAFVPRSRHWPMQQFDPQTRRYQLGEDDYMALGDNSYSSSDSRMWGAVPESNLVGPGLFVYWPFEHWGVIR